MRCSYEIVNAITSVLADGKRYRTEAAAERALFRLANGTLRNTVGWVVREVTRSS